MTTKTHFSSQNSLNIDVIESSQKPIQRRFLSDRSKNAECSTTRRKAVYISRKELLSPSQISPSQPPVVRRFQSEAVKPPSQSTLNDVTNKRRTSRRIAKIGATLARNTVTSMTSASGGFYHKKVIAQFQEARRLGIYNDNGFVLNGPKSVVQLELDMWESCWNLFRPSLPPNIHLDASIWGKRNKSKKMLKGVKRSPTAFRLRLSEVMQVLEHSPVGKMAIFLIVTGCSDTENAERLVQVNVLIVTCEEDDSYTCIPSFLSNSLLTWFGRSNEKQMKLFYVSSLANKTARLIVFIGQLISLAGL